VSDWLEIRDMVVGPLPASQQEQAAKDCAKFHSIAKDIGMQVEIPTADIQRRTDEIALLVFSCFLKNYDEFDFKPSCPSRQLVSELKEYLGNVDPSLIIRSSQTFSSVVSHLDTNSCLQLQRKVEQMKSSKGIASAANGVKKVDDEGQNEDIKLFPFVKFNKERITSALVPDPEEINVWQMNLLDVHSVCQAGMSRSEEDKVQDLFRKDYQFEDGPALIETKPSTSSASASTESTDWDRGYLLNLIGNEDVMQAVIGTIDSDKGNDLIQEHLFDLLGFDKFELIMSLLNNRDKIVRNLHRDQAVAQAVRNHVKSSTSTQSHPVIGVKVQSAEEKYLEKLYRKEEKKAQKKGDYISGTYEAELQVGQAMRTKIQKANSKSFSSGFTAEFSAGDLPNVYDSYAQAKQSAGFISGVKMVLPENAVRKDCQEYEQISLPAVKATVPPSAANKELIQIASLDPVAQQVFRGMKCLNRIQTLVFETAYKTNENLLICAPTGK
jgi:predicted nucleotidyltransferase component of viral defense system